MKILPVLIFLSVIVFACRPVKKIQKLQGTISKVDTIPTVVVEDSKTENKPENKNEVAVAANDLFEKVIKNKIDFSYFTGKVRVEYQSKEGADDATAFIRLKKDSAMWLSLRGALGIEGFRVLITRDSVKVMNPLKKDVQFRTISYLQEITGIPLDFATLQDLVVGNPVFMDSNIISYKIDAGNQLLVLMQGKVFRHLATLNNTNLKILHSKLYDANVTCDISYGDYQNTGIFSFAASRKISITEQSKLDVNLEFKQYSFNQPVTFPFNIPKNYKRL